MCGIAGILSTSPSGRPPAEQLLALAGSMADTLVHRGPDDHGVWCSPDGELALSHRRLAIVDLSPLGRNPMLWDDGRLAITFNGEIYNFLELRRELEALGCRFRSHTDTEVILAAYDQWGTDCLGRLAGMFAFALWDQPRRRLWLARDRVGKKPLYVSERPDRLCFASELKALLADPTFERRIDRQAISAYLKYGYVPAPFTIFEQARKLPPGHYLLHEDGRSTVTRYWDPLPFAESPAPLSDTDAEAQLESLLGVAVSQRRIADVPLGAFLSGGIDSSLVVALMAEQSGRPVQTYTIRFENPAYNEADHAAAVARHLRTEHHEMLCGEREMLDLIDRLPGMFDEPFADSSAIPTWLVSAAARTGVTVALSGDGGDELFFGYPRYRFAVDAGWALRLPRPVRRMAAALARRAPTRRLRRIADILGQDEGDAYSRFVTWLGPDDVRRMTRDGMVSAPMYDEMERRSRSLSTSVRPGLLDLVSYLPDDILTKVDRTSMAVSLEVRAPLLDHRVMEFALRLPPDLKRRGNVMKWLLRRLLHKRVPAALVERPKMGFGVPLRDWFAGALREPMNDYCMGDDFDRLGLDPRPIREMWAQFTAGTNHRPDLLWQAFVLAAWSRRNARAGASA